MFIVMYWGSGLTDHYPLVSFLLLSTCMGAAQWSNTNTTQKVAFEKVSLKNITFDLSITNSPVTIKTTRSSLSSP